MESKYKAEKGELDTNLENTHTMVCRAEEVRVTNNFFLKKLFFSKRKYIYMSTVLFSSLSAEEVRVTDNWKVKYK